MATKIVGENSGDVKDSFIHWEENSVLQYLYSESYRFHEAIVNKIDHQKQNVARRQWAGRVL